MVVVSLLFSAPIVANAMQSAISAQDVGQGFCSITSGSEQPKTYVSGTRVYVLPVQIVQWFGNGANHQWTEGGSRALDISFQADGVHIVRPGEVEKVISGNGLRILSTVETCAYGPGVQLGTFVQDLKPTYTVP
jgi:hypothetical protein